MSDFDISDFEWDPDELDKDAAEPGRKQKRRGTNLGGKPEIVFARVTLG